MTVGAVGVGLAGAGGAAVATTAATSISVSSPTKAASVDLPLAEEMRQIRVNRSADRIAAVAATSRVDERKQVRYTTDGLDVRTTPADDAAVVTEISQGTRVKFTGVTQGRFAQVSWQGELRWVTAQYLSADRPPPDPATLGLSDAPCPDGSVEHGLTDRAVKVYRAVCHAFPDITSYGGWDNHGEHSSGKAIDIMHPSVEEGYKIAEFLRAHASELELYDVIWRQHIWTPVRSGEGWRSMPNRGSATANHFDHVHVSVN
ncbi:MAG: hypothetical protein JWO46_453 [Nocardioidaceae bacterium]|nr:hypothetical protein [Nocardioidaceae bacterium]